MYLREYQFGDVHLFEPRREAGLDLARVEQQAMMGVTTTFLHQGEVIAIGGMIPHWRGYSNSWFLTGDAVRSKAGLALTKSVKYVIETYIANNYIHRLDTYVSPDNDENVRWIELLGFERESLARRVMPNGDDMYVYVMLKEH